MKSITPKQLEKVNRQAEAAIRKQQYAKAIDIISPWLIGTNRYLMDTSSKDHDDYWTLRDCYIKLKAAILSLAVDDRLADPDRGQIFDLLLEICREILAHDKNFKYIDMEYNRALLELSLRQARVDELISFFKPATESKALGVAIEHQTLLFLLLHRSGATEEAYAFQKTIPENFNFEGEVTPYLNNLGLYEKSFEIMAKHVDHLLDLPELPSIGQIGITQRIRIFNLAKLLPKIGDEQLTKRYRRLFPLA